MNFLTKLLETEVAWNDMASAPRDGSEIEIRCTYGFEPWVQRARWEKHEIDGPIWKFGASEHCFTFVEDINFGPRSNGANNSCLHWRPVK